jgi:hypothetical protein
VELNVRQRGRFGKTIRIVLQVSGFCVLTAAVWSIPAKSSKAAPAKKLDYNRDIRHVIEKCFTCHGHDSKAVAADLRLDQFATATKKLPSGEVAIVPFHPEKSELIERINAKNALQMPPPSSNKTLSADEKLLLKQWIAEGAVYKKHWAFVAPVRPAVPPVRLTTWPVNPIDNFILAKLEEEGLKPSAVADKRTLIRRVTLDLIGEPPTTNEVNAFLADKSPNAYEKVVDRLFASPKYGERMAIDWMDCSRYADSNGFQSDYERFQYRWRDWVINAYNKNLPFDEFTVDQLAGDLLPNPTLEQQIATGFNRNNRVNTEGGIISEEWRVEMVIDRVETTTATWLGLTAGCARCHDHKYDPISQKEFYSLNSYFSNIPEEGTGVDAAVNQEPYIKAPYPDQTRKMAELVSKLTSYETQQRTCMVADRKAAENLTVEPESPDPAITQGQIARYTFSDAGLGQARGVPAPTLVGKPKFDIGRSTGSVVTGGDNYLDMGSVGDFDGTHGFSYGCWINPNKGSGSPVAKMDSPHDYRGYDMYLQGGRVAAHFINKWPENALKVVTKMSIPNGQWTHVLISNDGSRKPEGVHIYINGKAADLDTETNALKGTMHTDVPLTVGRRTGSEMFDGQVDDLVVYDRATTAADAAKLADVNPATPFLRIPADKRTPAQKDALSKMWAYQHDPTYKKLEDARREAAAAKDKLDSEIPTVSVMQEMAKPRDCYVLIRGQYDKHGPKVTAGVPSFLPPLPKGVPNNRLGLAKWIVDPSNPLTARVAVNRFWERLFGIGIVATSEDFGTRAEYPSNPELLDWLATEFIRTKWNVKGMLKEMLMSATYRQSSSVTPDLLKRDPMNRLLARGPRFRLPAEVIRDQALDVAGLLVEKIGGRSVRPYQPAGIWDETAAFGNLINYKHDKGEGLYRKSLYTIWKRTASPPELTLFDVPSRETCRISRARTNTPLQALILLNDVTYVEAARVFAARIIREGGRTPNQRLDFAFETLLGRPPASGEMQLLREGLNRALAHYKLHPKAAQELISQGDAKNDPKTDPVELAAYTITASALLNLDETLTKE